MQRKRRKSYSHSKRMQQTCTKIIQEKAQMSGEGDYAKD